MRRPAQASRYSIVDSYDNHARIPEHFAAVDAALIGLRGGHWSVDFRAVPYDVAAAVAWSRAHSPFGEAEAQLLQTGEMTARSGSPKP